MIRFWLMVGSSTGNRLVPISQPITDKDFCDKLKNEKLELHRYQKPLRNNNN